MPLCWCAGDLYQFSGDFRSRAERPNADIAARQFFGDNTHGQFAHARTTVIFPNRQPEDAKVSKFIDDRLRDQLICPVPAMCVRHDLFVGEAAELTGDHRQGFIQTRRAKVAAPLNLLDDQPAGPIHGKVSAVDDIGVCGKHRGGFFQPEMVRTKDLVLAHRHTMYDLIEIFGRDRAKENLFQSPERSLRLQVRCPVNCGVKRLGQGGDPGESVPEELVVRPLFQRQCLAHSLAVSAALTASTVRRIQQQIRVDFSWIQSARHRAVPVPITHSGSSSASAVVVTIPSCA